MPKETKKFINPLLGPSQGNDEPRPTPTSDITVAAEVPSPVIDTPSDTEVIHAADQKQAVAEVEETSAAVPGETGTSPEVLEMTETSNSKSVSRDATRKPRTTTASTRRQSTSEPESGHESKSVQNANEDDSAAYHLPESVVTSSYNMGRSAVGSQNSSARSTRSAAFSSRDIDVSAEYITHRPISVDDDPGVEGGSVGSAPRRRRHVQSFESTHERITLWIDSQLKQDFEDLAQGRNTSKTALLDEAIADLLRKYHRYEVN